MLDLLQRALAVARRRKVDDVVAEIVKRSVTEVKHRLNANLSHMEDAELRGYVRARALRPVRETALRVAADEGWRTTVTDSLIANALEQTVHSIVYETKMQPIVALSSMHTTFRAAS